MCKVGYLYNYDALLKALIDKTLPKKFRYIKKLKDIKKLNI